MWTPNRIQAVAACVKSPEYFVDTFGWMDADEGIVPFNIGAAEGEDFYYQRQILQAFIAGDNILILKSRRAGLSWIAALICAWGVNFHRGWNALLVSRTEKEAISLLAKVKFILDNLAYKDAIYIEQATDASWLRNNIVVNNQRMLAIGHKNDRGEVSSVSKIESLTTTKHSGRGEKSRFVFVDEVQFIENQDEVFGSVLTTGARAGQWMMGSNAGDVGTRFHHMCLVGKAGENKTFWYREVWPEETGIDKDDIDAMSEAMPQDIINQEWYLTFRQPGNAVFNHTHLAACYKPPDMYPEIDDTLKEYRQKVINGKGEFYYYNGVDSAVGKSHRKSREKDYNAWVSLTMTGIQAHAYYDKRPLSTWAGQNVTDENGVVMATPGKVVELHNTWPGLAIIEEQGPGQVVLSRYELPQDGVSDYRPITMSQPVKSRLIKNLIIAIESHTIVITDEKTYQQLSMYQYGDKPDTYEAPIGFNDDLVMALAMALEALRIEGGFELSFVKSDRLEDLELRPFEQRHKELVDLSTAAVAPVQQYKLPTGARPLEYMPRPFQELPAPADEQFLPNPFIIEELNRD